MKKLLQKLGRALAGDSLPRQFVHSTKISSGEPSRAERILEDIGAIKKQDEDGKQKTEKASGSGTDPMMEQPAPGINPGDLKTLLALYTSSEWTNSAIERKISAVTTIRRIFKKKNSDGKFERAEPGETHLENLLNRPNKVQIWSDFAELIIIDLSLCGWTFWEKSFENGDPKGKVNGLKRLRPDRIKIVPDPKDYWKGIDFEQSPGVARFIPAENLFTMRNWSPFADYWPVSPSMASQTSAIWEFYGKAWNNAFFRNGAAGMPEGVFQTEYPLSEQQVDQVETAIKNRLGHPDVWRSILILHSGLKFNKTAFTQHDIQFAELMDRARDAQLATQGVPPAMVGVAVSGAGNFQEQKAYFYQLTVVGLAKRIEESINLWLAPEDERIEFDWQDVLSLVEDLDVRARSADSEVNRGIMTINEVRAERGLKPVPWGDTWHAPLGLAPYSAPGRPERPEGLEGDPDPERITPSIGDPSFEGERHDLEMKKELVDYFDRLDTIKASMNVRHRMQRKLAGRYRVAFERIKAEVLRRFRDQIVTSKRVRKADDSVPQFDFRSLNGIPLSDDDVLGILIDEVGGEVLNQTNVAARVAARGLGVDFKEVAETDPSFKKAFESWKKDRLSSTANTIRNRVIDAAEKARVEGLDSKQALDRMSDEFDRLIEQRISDLVPSDATTFSNTAILAQGRDTYTHKQWMITGANTRDGRYGENHVVMNSVIVPIDAPFEVPGRNGIELMDAPGDPSAGPWNTSRCECHLQLLTEEEARAQGAI